MIHPTRKGLVRYFRWLTRGKVVNNPWGELMVQGILNCKPQAPVRATPFTDAQLRSCRTPTLLLVGEQSVIYDPARVLRRAAALIPAVTGELVSGASHGLNYEQANLVNSRVLAFLEDRGNAA